MTGQQKVLGDLRGGDRIAEGGPLLITTKQSAPSLRATLNQRLIQAGITILNAHLAPAVLKAQNDQTNSMPARVGNSRVARDGQGWKD